MNLKGGINIKAKCKICGLESIEGGKFEVIKDLAHKGAYITVGAISRCNCGAINSFIEVN